MSNEPPRRSVRWHARDVGSRALGWLLSIASSLLRIAPLWALHLLYEALPETPLGTRALGQSLAWIDSNLRESGFADAAPQRRAEIARASVVVSTRLFFFVYLCGLLPSERFERFMLYVIDVAGFEALGRQVAQSGAVIATVHSDLFFSVPIYLMARGMPVSCVADRFVLGAALASDRDIRETFPTLFPAMLDSRGLTTGKELLMRLRRGEVVGVAFDAQPQREALGEAMPRIPFLGREVRRFDGAAWLGVRAGKPLLFISTYRHGKRTVPQVTLLRADASRPIREQVAALTAQMYALGEACIREHPESWMVWSYFHELGPVCA